MSAWEGSRSARIGKWHEFYDATVQQMKREARKVQQRIKQAFRSGDDVKSLVAEFRDIGHKAKARWKMVLRERAEKIVEQVEKLKAGDAKAGWRALKGLMHGMSVKASAGLDTVLDANGVEKRGREARQAVQDAYHALWMEDLEDQKFDERYARHTRLFVRRVEAERRQQDELDSQFVMKELEAAIKSLEAGKAWGRMR